MGYSFFVPNGPFVEPERIRRVRRFWDKISRCLKLENSKTITQAKVLNKIYITQQERSNIHHIRLFNTLPSRQLRICKIGRQARRRRCRRGTGGKPVELA